MSKSRVWWIRFPFFGKPIVIDKPYGDRRNQALNITNDWTEVREVTPSDITLPKDLWEKIVKAIDSCEPGDYSTGFVIHPSFDEEAIAEARQVIELIRKEKG